MAPLVHSPLSQPHHPSHRRPSASSSASPPAGSLPSSSPRTHDPASNAPALSNKQLRAFLHTVQASSASSLSRASPPPCLPPSSPPISPTVHSRARPFASSRLPASHPSHAPPPRCHSPRQTRDPPHSSLSAMSANNNGGDRRKSFYRSIRKIMSKDEEAAGSSVDVLADRGRSLSINDSGAQAGGGPRSGRNMNASRSPLPNPSPATRRPSKSTTGAKAAGSAKAGSALAIPAISVSAPEPEPEPVPAPAFAFASTTPAPEAAASTGNGVSASSASSSSPAAPSPSFPGHSLTGSPPSPASQIHAEPPPPYTEAVAAPAVASPAAAAAGPAAATAAPTVAMPPAPTAAAAAHPRSRDISPSPSNASASSRLTAENVTSAEDPYAFLATFDTIFVIDDSGSMAGRSWKEVHAVLANITPICTAHDADGIDIYFLNHRSGQPAVEGKASGGYRNVRDATTVGNIFKHVRPGQSTPTGTRINNILRPYLRLYEQRLKDNGNEDPPDVKPINMIVITDGVPTDDPEAVLISAAQKLDKLDAPPYQVGIQFFQVGNEPEAQQSLQELDDNLGAEVAGGIRDMVDTVTWDAQSTRGGAALTADGILKVVLGAVVKRLDRKPTAQPTQNAPAVPEINRRGSRNGRRYLGVP